MMGMLTVNHGRDTEKYEVVTDLRGGNTTRILADASPLIVLSITLIPAERSTR